MQGHRKPNEFHVKWRRKTRPINVRLEEISDISRCCNSFAGAAVSSNRNTAGRPKWKKCWRRCGMGDWKRRQRDRREGVPACVSMFLSAYRKKNNTRHTALFCLHQWESIWSRQGYILTKIFSARLETLFTQHNSLTVKTLCCSSWSGAHNIRKYVLFRWGSSVSVWNIKPEWNGTQTT